MGPAVVSNAGNAPHETRVRAFDGKPAGEFDEFAHAVGVGHVFG